MSKGLKKHVLDTAHQPVKLKEQSGKHFKPGGTTLLTDSELKKHDEDSYEQKQAAIQKVIYQTINKSTFLQIKNETDAAAI
jgi:hypothetical protein